MVSLAITPVAVLIQCSRCGLGRDCDAPWEIDDILSKSSATEAVGLSFNSEATEEGLIEVAICALFCSSDH